MAYETTCRRCYGQGKTWRGEPCPVCKGAKHEPRYRRVPAMADVDWAVNSWPRYGLEGRCQACGGELTGRKTVFCSERCRIAYWARMYQGVHWMKRHVVVRDGCACRSCGETFIATLREGTVLLPLAGKLELDHVKPLEEGGSDHEDNLQLLCPECHRTKTSLEARARATRRREPLFRDAAHAGGEGSGT